MSKQSISSLQPNRDRYEVVIIGGGAAALATAYYLLRQHNIRDIAVVAPDYFGDAPSGIYSLPADRSRWNYLALSQRSQQLRLGLAGATGKAGKAATRGLLSLAEAPPALAYARGLCLHGQRAGIDNTLLAAAEFQQLLPELAVDSVAASWQPDVELVDELDLLTSYAGALHSQGVDLVESCPPTAIDADGASGISLQLGESSVHARKVACCLQHHASAISELVGRELPMQHQQWQLWRSAPSSVWLEPLLYSLDTRSWLSQDSRGVISISSERSRSYEALASWSRLLPGLKDLRLSSCLETDLESGLDQAPLVAIDYAPGLLLSCGWACSGDLAPAVGEFLAHSLVHGNLHPALRPFDWRRFADAQAEAI